MTEDNSGVTEDNSRVTKGTTGGTLITRDMDKGKFPFPLVKIPITNLNIVVLHC